MRVAVWGAGDVGTALAYRLVTSPHVSELHWINRTVGRIHSRVVDLEHGLALSPNCRRVIPYPQDRASQALDRADIVALTLGNPVQPGEDRAALWPANRKTFRDTIVPILSSRNTLALVVSNPVDALTSLLHRDIPQADSRFIGLGTTVETARLRASLVDTLLVPAREIPVFAVGTHDRDFVPVWSPLGDRQGSVEPGVLDAARREAAGAAERIRRHELSHLQQCTTCRRPRPRSTRHPIVEAAMRVIEAIAADSHSILTVSTFDRPKKIAWSVPTTLGRHGVVKRHDDWLDNAALNALDKPLRKLQQLVES